MVFRMKKRLSLRHHEMIRGYLFVLPWVIGFILFFGNNLVQTIIYSFNKITINPEGGYSLSFMGIENFKNAFMSHATFNRSLADSLINMLVDVPLIIFFSLFMAILINKKFHGRALVRAILFLPVIMATAAITTAMDSSLAEIMGGMSNMANMELSQTADGLNASYITQFLLEFGAPAKLVEYVIGAISRIYEIVRASGVQILIFLASLQSISSSLYEVAKIEGATAYETFWKVTFPMVSPLIITNMVYTIVDLYSKTKVIELATNTAFVEMNFGLSSAMTLSSSICVSLVLVVATYFVSRKVFYQT